MKKKFEHATQDQFESYDLTTAEWKKVISKVENSPGSDLYMYILRSWQTNRWSPTAVLMLFAIKLLKT